MPTDEFLLHVALIVGSSRLAHFCKFQVVHSYFLLEHNPKFSFLIKLGFWGISHQCFEDLWCSLTSVKTSGAGGGRMELVAGAGMAALAFVL